MLLINAFNIWDAFIEKDKFNEITNINFNNVSNERIDYIVLHINYIQRHGLNQQFYVDLYESKFKKVFSVERAYDLEMVSIWKK